MITFLCVYYNRQLLEDPKVLFAGYKMPHPLDHYFVLKVQTTPDTTPAHVLGNALTELIQNVGSMKNKFEVGMAFYRYFVVPCVGMWLFNLNWYSL